MSQRSFCDKIGTFPANIFPTFPLGITTMHTTTSLILLGFWAALFGITEKPLQDSSATTSLDPSIVKAMKAVEAAAPEAQKDPTRPIYHYTPPSGWISDPDAPIFYQGYYHTFYIHNPYGPEGWPKSRNHWGHARSRDLVHWEDLPIALAPLSDCEDRCNSGCLAINGDGIPLIFYTHVPLGGKPCQQWTVAGSDDLIYWKRSAKNPILSLKEKGLPPFEKNWRDPFVFQTDGRTYLILTAKLNGKAVVPIFEATDASLLDWRYRGIFFEVPDGLRPFFECPNFVKLGEKWVLIGSGLGPSYAAMYFVGSFDPKTGHFTAESRGLLDQADNFLYATNTLYDDRGRCILLSRVKHFKPDRAWNGCLALPRVLSLDSQQQNRLIQRPVPELSKLRTNPRRFESITIDSASQKIDGVKGKSLEIRAVIEPGTATAFGLNLRCSEDGNRGVLIRYDGKAFTLGEHRHKKILPCAYNKDHPDSPSGKLPYHQTSQKGPVTLHVFLDRSVLELFVDDGQGCATQVIYPEPNDQGLRLFAEGGSVRVRSLEIWEMKKMKKPHFDIRKEFLIRE